LLLDVLSVNINEKGPGRLNCPGLLDLFFILQLRNIVNALFYVFPCAGEDYDAQGERDKTAQKYQRILVRRIGEPFFHDTGNQRAGELTEVNSEVIGIAGNASLN